MTKRIQKGQTFRIALHKILEARFSPITQQRIVCPFGDQKNCVGDEMRVQGGRWKREKD